MGASWAIQTYIAGNGHVGDHGWKIRVRTLGRAGFFGKCHRNEVQDGDRSLGLG